jgi:hypothetical protein
MIAKLQKQFGEGVGEVFPENFKVIGEEEKKSRLFM